MKLARLFVMPVALFALLLAGCDAAGPDTADLSARYDGESVYRGVIFGQGAVAALFPEIWNQQAVQQALDQMSPDQLDQYLADRKVAFAAFDDLVEIIRNDDPAFFERFGADMQSGEHLRVQAALEAGFDKLVFAAAAKEGVDTETFKAELTRLDAASALEGAGKGTCINYVLVVNVALWINAAVQVNVAAQINAALQANLYLEVNIYRDVHFWAAEEIPVRTSRLGEDLYVDLMTLRLDPAS